MVALSPKVGRRRVSCPRASWSCRGLREGEESRSSRPRAVARGVCTYIYVEGVWVRWADACACSVLTAMVRAHSSNPSLTYLFGRPFAQAGVQHVQKYPLYFPSHTYLHRTTDMYTPRECTCTYAQSLSLTHSSNQSLIHLLGSPLTEASMQDVGHAGAEPQVFFQRHLFVFRYA